MLGIRTEQNKKQTEKTKINFQQKRPPQAPVIVKRSAVELPPFPPLPPKTPPAFQRIARFYQKSNAIRDDFFHRTELPLHQYDPELADGFFLPSVIFDEDFSRIRSMAEKAVANGAKHATVGNLGHFALLDGLGLTLHGDFRLNLMNSFSFAQFPQLADAIASPELNNAQLRDLRGKKSVIVYGLLPLMLLEKPCGANLLKDRRGIGFPVIREGGRDLILNSVPIYMSDRKKELKEKGLSSQYFLFTTENPSQIRNVIDSYRQGLPPKGEVRRMK
jgi:hypothetical protein